MPRIVHFELHAAEPAKAAKFYESCFNWKFQQWDGPEEYWLATTGPDGTPGINGGLMKSRDGQPRTVNTIEVDSVDESAQVVQRHGGQVVVPRWLFPALAGWPTAPIRRATSSESTLAILPRSEPAQSCRVRETRARLNSSHGHAHSIGQRPESRSGECHQHGLAQ